ncbi:hypothetical protein EDC01DRAFT_64788 [Geopyxis carbonaria]|nr:hypothetical protein EDC01DRAFT_64788 [Geopyxis carbonaria]
MTTTPPPELQLWEEDIELLQRIINIYHGRLNAAWATFFFGEAVPCGHENAPDITSWAPSEISRVLQSFKRHLLYPRYRPYVTTAMLNHANSLIESAEWLVDNCDLAEPDFDAFMARSSVRDDLEAVEEILVDKAGEMGPLWSDRTEGKEQEVFANRFPYRNVHDRYYIKRGN